MSGRDSIRTIFDGGRPDRDYMLRDQELMAAATNYFAWQARLVLPRIGRRPLEIGCGSGNFTRHLLRREEVVIAADHEPAMLGRLRARFPDARNLITAEADADDAGSIARLSTFNPDSCVCLNVLEHVRDDAAALQALARAIRRHGPIVLIVPAFPGLYGPVDRRLGHFRRYTRESLTHVVETAGLRVKEMRYVNAAGFFGWWLNARVLKRDTQSPRQIAMFDRWIVPVMRRVEWAVRMPLGQSLFAVVGEAQAGTCANAPTMNGVA